MRLGQRIGLLSILFLSSAIAASAQNPASAAQSVENLRAQLQNLESKETELQTRSRQLDEDLKPENIEKYFALNGSTHPEELREQFTRFCELMGRPPTHLDSHHNIHRDPQVLPYFLELAHEHGLPLREHSPVRYFSKFYGQWGGQTHLEQVSVASLIRMLETEMPEGLTELSCHPGYVEPTCATGYGVEREAEVRTLCDPVVREALAAQSIHLVSYNDLSKVLANAQR